MIILGVTPCRRRIRSLSVREKGYPDFMEKLGKAFGKRKKDLNKKGSKEHEENVEI